MGATETTPIPARVWKRVLDRYDWECQHCHRDKSLYKALEKDHIVALVNWLGPPPHGNRESNIWPLCEACHGQKTKADVASKAKASRCKEMRPGYKRPKKYSSFKSPREGKWKYNWQRRRYERVDQ